MRMSGGVGTGSRASEFSEGGGVGGAGFYAGVWRGGGRGAPENTRAGHVQQGCEGGAARPSCCVHLLPGAWSLTWSLPVEPRQSWLAVGAPLSPAVAPTSAAAGGQMAGRVAAPPAGATPSHIASSALQKGQPVCVSVLTTADHRGEGISAALVGGRHAGRPAGTARATVNDNTCLKSLQRGTSAGRSGHHALLQYRCHHRRRRRCHHACGGTTNLATRSHFPRTVHVAGDCRFFIFYGSEHF